MKSDFSAIAGAMLMMLVMAASLYVYVPEFGITTTVSLFILSSVLMVLFSFAGRKSFFIIVLAAIAFGYINILSSGVVLIASVVSGIVLVIARAASSFVGNPQGKKINKDGISNPKVRASHRYDHEPIEAYSAGGLPIDYNDGSRIDINPARSIDDLM